jgi:hypothetical protein
MGVGIKPPGAFIKGGFTHRNFPPAAYGGRQLRHFQWLALAKLVPPFKFLEMGTGRVRCRGLCQRIDSLDYTDLFRLLDPKQSARLYFILPVALNCAILVILEKCSFFDFIIV